MSAADSRCLCAYELVEDGAVQRKHLFPDPGCPLHGSAVRTAPDMIIDGRPYRGELIFPDLEHLRA